MCATQDKTFLPIAASNDDYLLQNQFVRLYNLSLFLLKYWMYFSR